MLVPGAGNRLVGVAALPTETAVSRTALLTGKVERGTAAKERAGFEAHAGLREHSTPSHPPKLVHKAELTEKGSKSLSEAVRREMAGRRRRVIGVVVNAIDDALAGSVQVNQGFGIDQVPVLRQLLEAAAESGRAVVLASDHGHVIDVETERASGAGRKRARDAPQVASKQNADGRKTPPEPAIREGEVL